jgi:hypothetical protein
MSNGFGYSSLANCAFPESVEVLEKLPNANSVLQHYCLQPLFYIKLHIEKLAWAGEASSILLLASAHYSYE